MKLEDLMEANEGIKASVVRKAVLAAVPEYKNFSKDDRGRIKTSGWNGKGEPVVTVYLQTGLLVSGTSEVFDKAGTLKDNNNDKKIANAIAKAVGKKVKEANTHNATRGQELVVRLK